MSNRVLRCAVALAMGNLRAEAIVLRNKMDARLDARLQAKALDVRDSVQPKLTNATNTQMTVPALKTVTNFCMGDGVIKNQTTCSSFNCTASNFTRTGDFCFCEEESTCVGVGGSWFEGYEYDIRALKWKFWVQSTVVHPEFCVDGWTYHTYYTGPDPIEGENWTGVQSLKECEELLASVQDWNVSTVFLNYQGYEQHCWAIRGDQNQTGSVTHWSWHGTWGCNVRTAATVESDTVVTETVVENGNATVATETVATQTNVTNGNESVDSETVETETVVENGNATAANETVETETNVTDGNESVVVVDDEEEEEEDETNDGELKLKRRAGKKTETQPLVKKGLPAKKKPLAKKP